MNHTVLLDIDPALQERIGRIAAGNHWGQQEATVRLIELGLLACEADLAAWLDDADAQMLEDAAAALRELPDDPGFSLIGRVADRQ